MERGGELQLVTTNQHLFPAINGFTYVVVTFLLTTKLMMSF